MRSTGGVAASVTKTAAQGVLKAYPWRSDGLTLARCCEPGEARQCRQAGPGGSALRVSRIDHAACHRRLTRTPLDDKTGVLEGSTGPAGQSKTHPQPAPDCLSARPQACGLRLRMPPSLPVRPPPHASRAPETRPAWKLAHVAGGHPSRPRCVSAPPRPVLQRCAGAAPRILQGPRSTRPQLGRRHSPLVILQSRRLQPARSNQSKRGPA